VATSGTLAFAAGETSKTITVNVKGDTRAEPPEWFVVLLKNPTGAKVAGNAAGHVIDDDQAPGLSIDDVSIKEGNGGTTPAVFTVTLDAPYATSLAMKFAVTTGLGMCGGAHGASPDDVVQPVDNVVTIPAGMTSAKIT